MTQFNSFSSGGSSSVTVPGVLTPTIQNITVVSVNTEETIALPSGTKRFMIKSRTSNAKMQLAFSVGDSSIEFLTILPGSVYKEDGIDATASLTLYVQSSKANTVVELVSWA